MQTVRVAIVGGGLSGLHAAHLLQQKGVDDYVLLEARAAFGGRIQSASVAAATVTQGAAPGSIDRFDLGPTWFWPGLQPELDQLVRDLGLQRFAQYEAGDMVVERSSTEAPVRMRGYPSSPASMRLAGGMGAWIDALRHNVDVTRLFTGQTVRRLRAAAGHVELDSEDAAGHATTWRAQHVLLAMPPRLVAHAIGFAPALPPALARQWRATATWMAPHAKYLAIYDKPFWREAGLSGEARSVHGPLAEIHDASMPGGRAALFGFFGLPARVRRDLPDEVLRIHCLAQLARLFGPQAMAPQADFIKDWAQGPLTATEADLDAEGQHGEAAAAVATSGPWAGRITGIGSEWSPAFPGYLAGAIDASARGVQALLSSTSDEASRSWPRA